MSVSVNQRISNSRIISRNSRAQWRLPNELSSASSTNALRPHSSWITRSSWATFSTGLRRNLGPYSLEAPQNSQSRGQPRTVLDRDPVVRPVHEQVESRHRRLSQVVASGCGLAVVVLEGTGPAGAKIADQLWPGQLAFADADGVGVLLGLRGHLRSMQSTDDYRDSQLAIPISHLVHLVGLSRIRRQGHQIEIRGQTVEAAEVAYFDVLDLNIVWGRASDRSQCQRGKRRNDFASLNKLWKRQAGCQEVFG